MKLFSAASQLPASQIRQNPLDYLFLNKSEAGGSSLECTRIALLAGISRNSELSGSSRNAGVEGASWPIPAPVPRPGRLCGGGLVPCPSQHRFPESWFSR